MKNDAHNPESVAWHGRAIMLLDLDAFFASVEQLDHPEWRGKPVIVGGDATKRGVVSTASYEARAFGVHSAMPSSTAARLCPDAFWTHGHFSRYRELSGYVMDIMRDESPFIQQVSVDEAFLDITPGRFNAEDPVAIANRIQQRVSALGITCSIGLGVSKSVAKVASDFDKPRGMTVVYPGREQDFLSPLPIKCMSGIGTVAQERLHDLGINTLGEVVNAPTALLKTVFGKNAEMMRNRCRGCDEAIVTQPEPAKSVSHELSFAEDLTHGSDVDAALRTLCSKVARRLRKEALQGNTVTLKIRYGDRSIKTRQTKMPHPSCDEFEMFYAVQNLLPGVWHEGIAVRLLGVAMSHFDEVHNEPQSLFSDNELGVGPAQSDEYRKQIAHATDTVKDRFGEDALQYGSELKTLDNVTGTPANHRIPD